MSSIPVDRIKERASIADYIMEHYPHIKLQRSGNVFRADCPWHDERTSSFTTFQNGSYHCFGCGAHGDVIKLVEIMEGIDFKEACKVIAENVGVEYTITPPNPYHERYKDAMDEHTRRYWRVLQTNDKVLHYLRSIRGLTDESILKFRLGLVPEDEYKYRTDIGSISGRLAFPIMESKDPKEAKCLGMGYRTLKDENPKYKNDINQEGRKGVKGQPDQDANLAGVFIKGNNLFGYSHAYKSIKKQNFAIVTEGYMDAIALHQSGVDNSVASMGTALTENQMDALRRLTSNLLLFMDGDLAGIQAMIRILPMLYEKGFHVKMIIAENGMDAADVCLKKKFDTNAMKAYIASNSKTAMSVIIDRAASEYEQIVVQERLKAMNAISPILEKMSNQAERDIFKNMAYKRLDIAG